RRDVRRHAPDLVLRELIISDRAPELPAVERVVARLLERRLADAGRTASGLKTPGREAAHLEVEAAAEARLTANKVLFRHEVAVDRQRERVHSAIAGRRIGRPRDRTALRLGVHEVVADVRLLRNDNERETSIPERGVGV